MRKTSKKKAVVQEDGNVNDTDSDEDVEDVWVSNKPTENASEDFNSNDANVYDVEGCHLSVK